MDSDVDYRGSWLVDTNELLGLKTPKDHIERVEDVNDVVLFELKKEVNLLDKGNCNVLEHLFAPQLYTTDEYFSLKKIISLNLNIPGIYHSYRGLAWGNYNKFCLKGMHTVKKFLYVCRGILAGIHAIETRNIEPNLEALLIGHDGTFYSQRVKTLIRLKKQGKEKDFLPDSSLPHYHKLVEELLTLMDNVYEHHRPSDQVKRELDHSRHAELDKFLKKVRKQYMRKNNGDD